MNERSFAHFDPLRPTLALQALATADLELLRRAGVGFVFHAGRRRVRPSWWTPVVPQDVELHEQAVAELMRVGGGPTDRGWAKPPTLRPRSERPLALRSACWMMLAESGGDGSPALLPAIAEERLVIASQLDAMAQADLVEALLAHTTSLRIAHARSTSEHFLLAHVLEDPKRRATLTSYEAGGGLDDCELLACFRGETGPAVFLPPRLAPSVPGFEAFLTIWRRAPELFGRPGCERLAAVVEDSRGLRALSLDGLDFFAPERVVPRLEPFVRLEVQPLEATPGALDVLRRHLEAPREGRIGGHGLVLRPHRSTDDSVEMLRELEEEKARLEQHLAYLRASQTESPVLYRFAQHELATLADALRCFPPGELARLGLEYAFQAVPETPGGWHYLLCPPTTRQQEPFLWGRWLDLLDRPRGPGRALKFRHDPLWNREYAANAPWLEVYVPSGLRLFPSLHSWSPAEIDGHLRRMLAGGWFPERDGFDIPQRGLCLFDGEADDDELRVVVLDRGGFTPLTEELAWINDNLLLQRELGETRRWIGELAGVARERLLTGALERDAERRARDFEAVGRKTEEAVARSAEQWLETLRSELAELRTQGETMRRALGRDRRRLRRAAKVGQRAEGDRKTLDVHAEALAKSAEGTRLDLERLRVSIDTSYRELGELREQVEAQIDTLYRQYEKARRLL